MPMACITYAYLLFVYELMLLYHLFQGARLAVLVNDVVVLLRLQNLDQLYDVWVAY